MEGLAGGDVELICKTLQVEHKLFYFDLKENPRGRYLKISEKTSGSRSTIIVPGSGIIWFVDFFNSYANNDEQDSRELQLDTKTFYFDIGENQRGRFLKVSEASISSIRSTIIVPAGDGYEGWTAFRNILAEVHEASQLLHPSREDGVSSQHISSSSESHRKLPESVSAGYLTAGHNQKSESLGNGPVNVGADGGNGIAKVLRVDQKKFFFDLGSNTRGQYLRISEVIGNDRSAIILPVSALEQFYDTVGQFVDAVRNQGLVHTGVVNVRTVSNPRNRSES